MESNNDEVELKIRFLSLNLFLRPPPISTNETDYKDSRAQYFSSYFLCRYDIICLQETFSALSNRRKRIIEKASELNFKFIIGSPDPPLFSGCILDCGLLLLSKYPIIEHEFLPFEESLHPDRSSYKGVLYAKIQVKSLIFNVFTTHLQSKHPTDSSKKYLEYRLTRRTQIQEISNHIKQKVRQNELVIVTGDLNIDGREELKPPPFPDIELDDYRNLMGILSQAMPFRDLLRIKYGETPATFGRIGEDGNGIERVLTKEEECKFDEGLDYILVAGDVPVEIDWGMVKVEPFYTPGQSFTQISDHAGVQAGFKLMTTRSRTSSMN